MLSLKYPILIPPNTFCVSALNSHYAFNIVNLGDDIEIQLLYKELPFEEEQLRVIGEDESLVTKDEEGIVNVFCVYSLSVQRFLDYFAKHSEWKGVVGTLIKTISLGLTTLALDPSRDHLTLLCGYTHLFVSGGDGTSDNTLEVVGEYINKHKHLLFTEETITTN